MSAPTRRYGDGTVYLRGRWWYIKYHVDGRAFHEATHSEKRQDAVKLLHRRLAAVAEHRPTGREGERLTVADTKAMVQEDYRNVGRRSWSRVSRAFKPVERYFGERCKLSRITPDRLHQYLSMRLADGAARATVQKELAALKRGMSLAVERGLLPYRIAFPRLGKIDNARKEFVDDWEWALVRPHLPAWWQDMGDMALEMGWRCKSEFLGLYEKGLPFDPLLWDTHVDWDAGLLTKGHTKNGDPRVFPFADSPTVAAALQRRRAYTEDVAQRTGKPVPFVFHAVGRPITEHQFYAAWRAAWAKAAHLLGTSLPKRPHDFRRSAVRALENGGVPRSIAKALVGHRTDSMYERYAIRNTDDLRAAVRKLHAPPHPQEAASGAR